MKTHLKQWLALILVIVLAFSLTGVAEDSIAIEESESTIESFLSNEDYSTDLEKIPEEFNLNYLLDSSFDLTDDDGEVPATDPEIATPSATEAPAVTPAPIESVSNAIPTKITLGVKEKYTINTSGMKGKITFKSSKTKIATVSKKGVITAKKVGTTKITITPKKGKKKTITVKVMKAPTKVTLSDRNISLEEGDWWQLNATLPKKTASYKLSWTSSNVHVATVDSDGWVHAEGAGTATITVKTFNGKRAMCNVTVNVPAPTTEPTPTVTPVVTPTPTPAAQPLTVDMPSVSIAAGKKTAVSITYLYDNTIRWEVDNSSVATCRWVDGWDGDTCKLTIIGLDSGTTTVTVYDTTTYDSVEIQVTVSGSLQKVTELGYILLQDIAVANAMIDLKMSHYEDNMYTNDYFSVLVDKNYNIRTIGFFNDYGAYKLMGLWPGRNLSNAVSTLVNAGWKLQSDQSQIGTFTNSELPGCTLKLAYGSGKVNYIILNY